MDIYLTAKETNTRLRIPLLPDKISVTTGANFTNANVYNIGEVTFPRGTKLTSWSWRGVFPAAYMSNLGFVFDWQEPQRIVKLLEDWQANGYTVNLMITELGINEDAYIEKFTYDYSGAGNADYDIGLKKKRTLTVTTVSENDIPPKKGGGGGDGTKKKYKYAAKGVNVRKKASSKSTIIGKLKKGEKVEVLGKSGNWTHIVYEKGEDGTGWVKSTYLKNKKPATKKKSTGTKKKPKYNNDNGVDWYKDKLPTYHKPVVPRVPKKIPTHRLIGR